VTGERPTLTAYLETSASAGDAFGALATPSGYRRLVAGVADVREEGETEGGFRIALAAPGADPAAGVEDAVSVDSAARRISVRRTQGERASVSSYRALERGKRTYLLREIILPGRGEELLRNDSLRGRFAGSLAVDLLAWARMLNVASA
jgi:hypothetical protein